MYTTITISKIFDEYNNHLQNYYTKWNSKIKGQAQEAINHYQQAIGLATALEIMGYHITHTDKAMMVYNDDKSFVYMIRSRA